MAAMSSVLVAAPVVSSIPAVPGLPLVGNWLAFRRDRLALQDQAARLGPIARISMGHIPLYIVTCGDLAHDVLVEHDASFKKSMGVQFLRPLLGDGLLTAEGEPHRRHRKLLAPAFAPRRLAGYGEVMVAETREQIARWSPGERAIDVGMRAVDVAMTSPLQIDYRWPLPRHLRMRRSVAMLDDVVYRLIRDGRALGTDRGDVLSMLVLARDEDDGSQLADREVRD